MIQKTLIAAVLVIAIVGTAWADPPSERSPRELQADAVKRVALQSYGIASVGVVVEEDQKGETRIFFERGPPRTTLERARLTRGRPNVLEPVLPLGACDSDGECEAETDQMCKGAGYSEGVDKEDVEVVKHVDGSSTCSGGCAGTSDRGTTGGVAFVTCSP